jgi:hypothetical protein
MFSMEVKCSEPKENSPSLVHELDIMKHGVERSVIITKKVKMPRA